MLAGEMEIIVDEESLNPGPGMFVLVRAGQRHTFANPGREIARVLIVHAPPLDAYFAELDRLANGPGWNAEAESALMRRHGLEPSR